MSIANRPSLAELATMPIGDVVALPAEILALLQEDADAALRSTKSAKDWLDGAISQKFSSRAAECRRAEGKDTGSARFQDGSVTVVAELPKRVDWDQPLLAELVERIKSDGDDPREYVEISFKVSAIPSGLSSARH